MSNLVPAGFGYSTLTLTMCAPSLIFRKHTSSMERPPVHEKLGLSRTGTPGQTPRVRCWSCDPAGIEIGLATAELRFARGSPARIEDSDQLIGLVYEISL